MSLLSEVTVYGASDDLIEVEGDIREEFSALAEGPMYLAFSDGTVLCVEYGTSGLWHVNRVAEGDAAYEKVEATDSDSDEYSDRVTLTGYLKWVVAGKHYVPSVGPGEEAAQ